MPESSRTGADTSARTPRQLAELFDRMNPADIAAVDIDVDAIGRAVEPRKLGREELAAIGRLVDASAPVLFMTGKLKIRGDLAFAAGLTGYFHLPRP